MPPELRNAIVKGAGLTIALLKSSIGLKLNQNRFVMNNIYHMP